MNINDIVAASTYGSVQNQATPKGSMGQLTAQFASVFDKADVAAQRFATKSVDAQSVVEAFSQAELALQTAVTIRDRVVAAYQEVLRMPI